MKGNSHYSLNTDGRDRPWRKRAHRHRHVQQVTDTAGEEMGIPEALGPALTRQSAGNR